MSVSNSIIHNCQEMETTNIHQYVNGQTDYGISIQGNSIQQIKANKLLIRATTQIHLECTMLTRKTKNYSVSFQFYKIEEEARQMYRKKTDQCSPGAGGRRRG